MRLLKVCIDNMNIYVDLNGDKYRLRVYEGDIIFDREYKCLNKLNRRLKEFGFNFRVSDDFNKCEFGIIYADKDRNVIKFNYKGKVIHSTIKPKIETEIESNEALDVAIKVWEITYGGSVNKRFALNAWKAFIK